MKNRLTIYALSRLRLSTADKQVLFRIPFLRTGATVSGRESKSLKRPLYDYVRFVSIGLSKLLVEVSESSSQLGFNVHIQRKLL